LNRRNFSDFFLQKWATPSHKRDNKVSTLFL
jgi:hypothetical protein